jgi:DNA-binding response OmpR family regulator
MNYRILIIEHEPPLRKELVCAFREASFTVVDVSDYPEAFLRIEDFKPDIVVMEIGSPGRDGFVDCTRLRSTFRIPVVLLGKDSSVEMWGKVMEADADLYQTKPFQHVLLVARVKAILRRYKRRWNTAGRSDWQLGN